MIAIISANVPLEFGHWCAVRLLVVGTFAAARYPPNCLALTKVAFSMQRTQKHAELQLGAVPQAGVSWQHVDQGSTRIVRL